MSAYVCGEMDVAACVKMGDFLELDYSLCLQELSQCLYPVCVPCARLRLYFQEESRQVLRPFSLSSLVFTYVPSFQARMLNGCVCVYLLRGRVRAGDSLVEPGSFWKGGGV